MKEFVFWDVGPKPARVWGETPLFDLASGRKLLDFCDERGAAVLGIEGFRIFGDKRVPDLDCIADFSALYLTAREGFPAMSRESARAFLDSISDPEIYLEFLLVEI